MQTIYLVIEHSVYDDSTTPLKAFYDECNAEAYREQVEHSIRTSYRQRGINVHVKKIHLI